MLGRYFSAEPNIHTDDMKPFYALGVNMAIQAGDQLKPLLVKHEKDALVAGFAAYMHDELSAAEIHDLMKTHGAKLQSIIVGRMVAVNADKKQKGEDFIADYLARNPGAIKTEYGLVYHETATGTGEAPTADSTVTTHYQGTLMDGKVFDSSVDRGEPLSIKMNQVIQGWKEGISLMKVGGKATLVCPPELAYGEQGSPPDISGGATLIFEVELIAIK